jgi:hypothetical protein
MNPSIPYFVDQTKRRAIVPFRKNYQMPYAKRLASRKQGVIGNIFSQYAKYELAVMRNWNKRAAFQPLQPPILNGQQKLE